MLDSFIQTQTFIKTIPVKIWGDSLIMLINLGAGPKKREFEYFGGIFERYLQVFWAGFGGYLAYVWEVFGGYFEGF